MSDSHTYPRDFFLYLLATVTLYVSVISGLMLLFQFINLTFPDPLDYVFGVRNPSGEQRCSGPSLRLFHHAFSAR